MKNIKKITWLLLLLMICNVMIAVPGAYAAGAVSDNHAKAGNSNPIEKVLGFLLTLLLGPLLGNDKNSGSDSAALPSGGSGSIGPLPR